MPALTRRTALGAAGAAALQAITGAPAAAAARFVMQSWPLNAPRRCGIHDVAPAPDGGVWFTAQESGHLGWFDPKSGRTELVGLGERSAPHGVIQGPDQAAWITDGGRNAIVRVAWPQRDVTAFPLPPGTPSANLNTAVFDPQGDLWFTGQSGFVGRVTVKDGQVRAMRAPRGRGPYGICVTPSGDVWWCSLAGSFIAKFDRATGQSAVFEPPARDQAARRIWSDSQGRLWFSEWTAGQLGMYDPQGRRWKEWRLPGSSPLPYAVYVDEHDLVWTSDFAANAIVSFDPGTERFESHPLPRPNGNVRQIHGRPGEVWFGESGTEHIGVIRTA